MMPNSTALVRAVTSVIWLIVGMTLLAEQSAPFKSFLAQLAGQHWVGKSIIAAAAFFVFYFIFRRSRETGHVLGGVVAVLLSVILGGLIIFAFYLQHFLNG